MIADTWQRLLWLERECVADSVTVSLGAIGSVQGLADHIKALQANGVDFPADVRAGIRKTLQLVEVDFTPASGPFAGKPQKIVHFNPDRALEVARRVCFGQPATAAAPGRKSNEQTQKQQEQRKAA